MSPRWIWSDKITNERVARVGYNHFISNKGEWNNCFSKFSNRVLPPIFISTIFTKRKCLNLAHYFPYDVKLRILAHSRSFLANQKARNAIFGAENLLISDNPHIRSRDRDVFRLIARERKDLMDYNGRYCNDFWPTSESFAALLFHSVTFVQRFFKLCDLIDI